MDHKIIIDNIDHDEWIDIYEWFYENIPLELRPIIKYEYKKNWLINFKREEDKVKFILRWL